MKRCLTVVAVLLCAVLFGSSSARAQQFDVALGFHALTAPAASTATGNYSPVSMSSGLYPSFSADLLIFKHFGIDGEVTWRAGKNLYQGYQPFRPVLWSFNAIWAPPVSRDVVPEFKAGIGAASIRFYQNYITCSVTTCTNYVSSNHFMGHFGAGLRLYFFHNFFIRPEADVYLIRHNYEFSSGRVTQWGASLGYTFGSR